METQRKTAKEICEIAIKPFKKMYSKRRKTAAGV